MRSCRDRNRLLESPCVSARLKGDASFVRGIQDAGALQVRLCQLAAGIAGRLRQTGAAVPATSDPRADFAPDPAAAGVISAQTTRSRRVDVCASSLSQFRNATTRGWLTVASGHTT